MKDIHLIRLRVNGREHELAVEARRTLADMLRDDLGYTGTHLGCEHGICGACTVLVDGEPARSCLMFGVQADGAEISTVEGLADGDQLSDLQQSFSDRHGLQCGFCTPGFLMLAEGYLAARTAAPSRPRPRSANWSRPTCAGAPATRASSRRYWPPRGPGGSARPGRARHERPHPPAGRHRHPGTP